VRRADCRCLSAQAGVPRRLLFGLLVRPWGVSGVSPERLPPASLPVGPMPDADVLLQQCRLPEQHLLRLAREPALMRHLQQPAEYVFGRRRVRSVDLLAASMRVQRRDRMYAGLQRNQPVLHRHGLQPQHATLRDDFMHNRPAMPSDLQVRIDRLHSTNLCR